MVEVFKKEEQYDTFLEYEIVCETTLTSEL